MGAYLTHPVTEKISSDETNEWINCGVSSMQGWRISQEDAHNCILNLTEAVSLFAVYDGHGGMEVAELASRSLPSFITHTESFKRGDYTEALKEAFLNFDKSLTQPEIIATLKAIADEKNGGEADETDYEDDENIGNLKEEAEMPLEDVIAKYSLGKAADPNIAKWKRDLATPVSPYLRAKRSGNEAECTSSSSTIAQCGSSEVSASCSSSSSSEANVAEPAVSSSSSREITRTSLAEKYYNGEVMEVPDSSGDLNESDALVTSDEVIVNGNGVSSDKQDTEISSSENGIVDKEKSKGKGKALLKPAPSPVKKKESVSPDELFKKFVSSNPNNEDSSESDSDDNFLGPDAESSSDEEKVQCHSASEGADSSKPDSAGCDEDDEDEEEDIEEEEEEEEDEDPDNKFTMETTDEPGSDSGCTAVVALVVGDKVYVANAGDSRCVASRGGVAIDLSIDHKPEDELEMARITKAGGRVTSEGRVNGGLNLSRALGDHVYKQVADLSPEEQMISPMPDVKVFDITPDVEFLVLACDGIWNFMSSQQVVDFVRPRLINNPEKISSICEELFGVCLAPDTGGDGTGCDNMTAVIVHFRGAKIDPIVLAAKRKTSECETSQAEFKRTKTDTHPESTTDTPSCSSDPAP